MLKAISQVQKKIKVGTHGEDYGSWMSNPVFYVFGGGTLLAAVLAVPPVRSLFAFSMPDLRLALVGAAASVLCVGWCEWTRRRLQGRALRRP